VTVLTNILARILRRDDIKIAPVVIAVEKLVLYSIPG
jgi:hypothetical protein